MRSTAIQDAIDGRITRLDDSHWPPVVVSSQGAPFEVWQLLRAWTEIQRAETLDAEKAIAFSENLRRQSRWGEIDHHLLDMLKRELQEKYFVATGDEDDRFWDREYSLKPGIRAEQIPEPLLRFACYVAVSYKVYGLDFQYLDANYLFGLVEKVRPDTVVAAAITSRKAKNSLPTHILLENVPGLAPTSLLLLEQLRTIDRKRLRGYIGRISKEKMLEVDAALAISIGIGYPNERRTHNV